MFLLFFYYGPQLQEKAEHLVPVEVMVIKEVPPVAIRSAITTAAPRASTLQPVPLGKGGLSANIQIDMEMMVYASEPVLALPKIRLKPSSFKKRDAKAAPLQRVDKLARSSMRSISIETLAPEVQPSLVLDRSQGLIALAATQQAIPVPDVKTASPLDLAAKAPDDARFPIEKPLMDVPVMLAPQSEPAPLKMERPPTLVLPGSAHSASFILLVDTSGSVKGDPLQGIKASVVEFISLMGKHDRVGLMTLNDSPQLISDFTSKDEHLKHQVNGLKTAGKLTVLYDALLAATRLLEQESSKHLNIVLFSDGKDEGSRADLDQVLVSLKKSNISVLGVGYTRVAEKHLEVMRRIAHGTGGVFVRTPEFRDMLTLYKTASPAQKAAPYGATANQGALLVKSDPVDSDVYVDGKFLGTTPLVIDLPLGTFSLLLRNQCCYDWQAPIELSEPGELPLNIKLEPLSDLN